MLVCVALCGVTERADLVRWLLILSLSWLQRDISTKHNVSLITPDANPGKWYIGIYGFAACNYQLSAHVYGIYAWAASQTDGTMTPNH
jgi:hypothetical protein